MLIKVKRDLVWWASFWPSVAYMYVCMCVCMENKRRDSRLVLHVVDVKNPTNWDIAEIAYKWEKKQCTLENLAMYTKTNKLKQLNFVFYTISLSSGFPASIAKQIGRQGRRRGLTRAAGRMALTLRWRGTSVSWVYRIGRISYLSPREKPNRGTKAWIKAKQGVDGIEVLKW